MIASLFFNSALSYAELGDVLYSRLYPKPNKREYMFVWPELEKRPRDLQIDRSIFRTYVHEIQQDLGRHGIYKRQPEDCEAMVQNNDDLLRGSLKEKEVKTFQDNRIRYLVYGYVCELPEKILDYNRPVSVMVLKIFDLANMNLASIGIFEFPSSRSIKFEHAVPHGKTSGMHQIPIRNTMYLESNDNIGLFLVDLFNYMQISENKDAELRDGTLDQGFGRYDEEVAKKLLRTGETVGVVKLLKFPKENVNYVVAKRYIGRGDLKPSFLYRICGQNDVHLLKVAYSSIMEVPKNVWGESDSLKRIGIQESIVSTQWPYERAPVKEIYGYYLASSGLGCPVTSDQTYSLFLNMFRIKEYRRTQQALVPLYEYSLNIKRAEDGAIVFSISGALHAETETNINEPIMFISFMKKRLDSLLTANRFHEAELFINDSVQKLDNLLPTQRISALNAEWKNKLCAARFRQTFEHGLQKTEDLIKDQLILEAQEQIAHWRERIGSGTCLTDQQKTDMRKKLEAIGQ